MTEQKSLFGSDAEQPPTWTIGELAEAVEHLFTKAFPSEIWVSGEIRGFPTADQRRARRHLYFDLVETSERADKVAAALSIALFERDRSRVNNDLKRQQQSISMDNGVEVRIRGRLRWYGHRGQVQFVMTGIDPDYTLGRLTADRDALLGRLASGGLLDRNRSLTFPRVPRSVALITSRGSAAEADAKKVFQNAGLAHLIVTIDSRTQGRAASSSLAGALRRAQDIEAEVALLVRGGGSKIDLACFDTEMVAVAVAECSIPVLTGIGHEIDSSIADLVGYRAFATPTAAAEFIVGNIRDSSRQVESNWQAITASANSQLATRQQRLARSGRSIAAQAMTSIHAQQTFQIQAGGRLRRASNAVLKRRSQSLLSTQTRLGSNAARGLTIGSLRLDHLDARIRALDPQVALARGWSITFGTDGSLLRSSDQLQVGDRITVRLGRGHLDAEVTATHPPSAPENDMIER